ncbi:hypothetical protein GCM10020331_041180 [Ectobacillus funiculus]
MKCRELAPDIETALLYKFGVRIPWLYAKRLGVSAIHPNYKYIAAPVILADAAKQYCSKAVYGQ